MRSLKTLGGIGAVLTCPCHAVPLVLLLGGTAASAWLARHLPAVVVALGIHFALSLWLLLRREAGATAGACDISVAPGRDDVLRRGVPGDLRERAPQESLARRSEHA